MCVVYAPITQTFVESNLWETLSLLLGMRVQKESCRRDGEAVSKCLERLNLLQARQTGSREGTIGWKRVYISHFPAICQALYGS